MAYASVVSLAQTLEQISSITPGLFSEPTLKSLAGNLEYFKAFLDGSSNTSSYNQENVKILEGKFRDALNEAEDIIELKICEIHQIENIEKISEDLLGSLLPIVQKIELISKELVLSLESCTTHETEPAVSELIVGSPSRHNSKENLENAVVGRDDDLEKIVRRLLGLSSEREVVAITGMGGIGKTTLAKKAYDQPQVRSRFEIQAWVTVSQECGMRRLLLSLIHCIPSMTDSSILEKSEDQLAVLLYRKLKGRRYLVVIDDIWSTDVWDNVTRCFPNDNNGSRIILTSRLKDVAVYANPDSPLHEVGVLSVDDCWKLLVIKVFGGNDLCPSELEDIGKQIAEKCGGLPLAILVVAGHLSKIARRKESWLVVAKTVSSVVANDPDECLGVLGMSYNYLPNHLKPCFLSMGAFPEDFEIKARTLIHVWVAQGFLKGERLKSLEEVAEECLKDLSSRNLIMIRKRKFSGEIKSCGMHDLLRGLSLREAQKEKFLHVTSTRYVSHFLTQRHEGRGFSFLSNTSLNDSIESSPHVARLIFFWGKQLISAPLHKQISLFASFKLIRVLAIFSHLFSSFPVEVTQLIHLRYLWIRSSGSLPVSVSKLYNLQTLVFQQPELYYMYKTLALPRDIWNMTQLRRLRLLSGNYLSKPKADNVLGLRNLEELSHLCFASCTVDVFSCLPNIRKLSILDAATDDASTYLKNLVHLEKLEKLKCVCYNEKLLSLSDWCASLTSLKRLTLSGCLLLSKDMSSLATLPNLEVLKLRDNEFEGNALTLSDEDEFNQLKFLLIAEPHLVNLEAGSVNFPNLQKLVLKKCIELEEIPIDIGEICTLEVIELISCSTSAQISAKEIQKEQESMGNTCLDVRIYGPWTEEDHRLFLLGLQKLSKGDWQGISRNFVTSRTPTEVASHAQKFFIRQSNLTRRKRRSSLFDIVVDTAADASHPPPEQQIMRAIEGDKEHLTLSATKEADYADSLPLSLKPDFESMETTPGKVEMKQDTTTNDVPSVFPAFNIPVTYPFWPSNSDKGTEPSHHQIRSQKNL